MAWYLSLRALSNPMYIEMIMHRKQVCNAANCGSPAGGNSCCLNAAEVVPLRIRDWLPVLYGSSFNFYVTRIDAALRRLYAQHGPVALVGHSAGGWVARIVLGATPYEGETVVLPELIKSVDEFRSDYIRFLGFKPYNSPKP